MVKRSQVTKPGKRATRLNKHQNLKVIEKGSIKVSKSKGASEKVNEDTETAEATISHLKRDKVWFTSICRSQYTNKITGNILNGQKFNF